MLIDAVRTLARDEIAPRAAAYDRTGEFPWDNVKAINTLGLNAMFIPEAYGGAQMSYAAYLECVREISKACAATGVIWATNFHAMKPLVDWGNEEQKMRLLPRLAKLQNLGVKPARNTAVPLRISSFNIVDLDVAVAEAEQS